MALGVKNKKVKVTGNMKFDSAFIIQKQAEIGNLRKEMSLHPTDDKLLVCGSTHAGEEAIILNAYRHLPPLYQT